MKICCPFCDAPIPPQDMNVANDLAICRRCQEAFAITDLRDDIATGSEFAMDGDAPRGTWFTKDASGWSLGASTRSLGGALGFLVTTAIWAGLSCYLITEILAVAGGFNRWVALYVLPLLAVGVMLLAVVPMYLAGRVTITVKGNNGRVFEGIGPFGRTRRFEWNTIVRIDEVQCRTQDLLSQTKLVLEGPRRLAFGRFLNEDRRDHLLDCLQALLARRDAETVVDREEGTQLPDSRVAEQGGPAPAIPDDSTREGSLKLACPTCAKPIPMRQLNIAKDRAICSRCRKAFSVAAVLQSPLTNRGYDPVRVAPRGAAFTEEGDGWTLRASTRSSDALFLFPLTGLVCVITCLMFLLVVGGLTVDRLDLVLSGGILGIAALVSSAKAMAACLMSLIGQAIITVEGNRGRVFQGIGPFGRTQWFDWDSITGVEEVERQVGYGLRTGLALEGSGEVIFGFLLSQERRYYLLQSLKALLARRSNR